MRTSRGARLPFYLALAYVFLVVYASLSPFTGWHAPGLPMQPFFTAPWSGYFTWFDVVTNFLAYIPLGFLFAVTLLSRTKRWRAVALAVIAAFFLSFSMEALQTFLPSRFSSNLDLLCNSMGGLVGAMLASLAGNHLNHDGDFVALRYQWFVPGHAADFALVVVGLWLLSQCTPAQPLFGSGDLHDLFPFDLAPHSPSLFALTEAAVVACNLLGIGLLTSAVLRHRNASIVLGMIAAALSLKALVGGLMGKSQAALDWITPGATAGLAGGALLLLALLQLTPRWRIYCALAAVIGAVVSVNLMPENPYFPEYLQEYYLEQGRYVNFNKLTHLLSELWPFLAFGSLLALLRNTRYGVR